MKSQGQTPSETVIQPTNTQPMEPVKESGSSMQPVPGPAKENKYLVIIIALLVVLCLGLAIAIVVIRTRTDGNYDDNADNTGITLVDDAEKVPFNSLTKNDVMNYLRGKVAKSKSERLPSGFLPQELILKSYETSLVLLPSYDSPSEILQTLFDGDRQLISFANFTYGFKKDDFKLDTNPTNHWTILSVDSTKCSGALTCPRGIAFEKKYLDYYNQYAGDGMSEDYKVKFNNLSQDFVKKALPILVFAGVESNGLSFADSVYDYIIEETDNKYILTLQSIGIQSKPEDYSAIMLGDIENISTPTAVNLYEVKFELDKQTGEVAYQKNESGGKTDIIKTFEVSEEDGEELKQMLVEEYIK